MSKCWALWLVAVLSVSSLLMIASAQSITKPSTPEFSVQFTGPSFNTSTITYYSNETGYTQYTGSGQYWTVEHNTLEITIKNQPFTPEVLNGETTNLFYFIQSKPHSSQNWTVWYSLSDLLPQQSNSEYTVLSYPWDGGFVLSQGFGIPMPNDTQVDIQVQAGNGIIGREIVNASKGAFGVPWVFHGVTSDWSNQTITTAMVNPNYSDTSGESPRPILLSPLLVAIIFAVALIVAAILVVYFKKRKH
jgi:hypothetical protein